MWCSAFACGADGAGSPARLRPHREPVGSTKESRRRRPATEAAVGTLRAGKKSAGVGSRDGGRPRHPGSHPVLRISRSAKASNKPRTESMTTRVGGRASTFGQAPRPSLPAQRRIRRCSNGVVRDCVRRPATATRADGKAVSAHRSGRVRAIGTLHPGTRRRRREDHGPPSPSRDDRET